MKMVMLFLNENTGDVEIVGYCDGWKASVLKRKLKKEGYKMIDKASGKYFKFEYVVYKCEKHNKYEIYYFKQQIRNAIENIENISIEDFEK